MLCYCTCVVAAATTTKNLPWHHPPPPLLHSSLQLHPQRHKSTRITRAFFSSSDFDGFAKRAASGEIWGDAWRSANNGFDQLLFESKKTAERIDRQYSVSRRLAAVLDSAASRARELDRHFEVTQRWRNFTLDFTRNWPKVCSFPPLPPSIYSYILLYIFYVLCFHMSVFYA